MSNLSATVTPTSTTLLIDGIPVATALPGQRDALLSFVTSAKTTTAITTIINNNAATPVARPKPKSKPKRRTRAAKGVTASRVLVRLDGALAPLKRAEVTKGIPGGEAMLTAMVKDGRVIKTEGTYRVQGATGRPSSGYTISVTGRAFLTAQISHPAGSAIPAPTPGV